MKHLLLVTLSLLAVSCTTVRSTDENKTETHILTVIDTVRVRDTTRVDIRTVGDTIIIHEYHNVVNDNLKTVGRIDTLIIEKKEKVIKQSKTMIEEIFDYIVLIAFCAIMLGMERLIRKHK